MAKPFDATTKQLLETYPLDWVRFLGLPADSVTVLDTDLSTVTTATDRVIQITAPIQHLVHIELEARRTAELDQRLLEQSVLLTGKYQLPVESFAFLLRRKTQASQTTGYIERVGADGQAYLTFGYKIVRLWEVPVKNLLSGGIGLLPLAPLGDVAVNDLPDVIRQMENRITAEAVDPKQNDILWMSTYILMGLEYDPVFIQTLLRGVEKLKESSTYQMILAEGEAIGRAAGKAEGERETILRLGEKRLGMPDASVRSSLENISDLQILERMVDRLLAVESWEELLAV